MKLLRWNGTLGDLEGGSSFLLPLNVEKKDVSVEGIIIMISHHHQSSFDDHHRFLIAKTMGGAASPMMIAWYCFIGFITLPILGCMFYCWWSRRRSHLRAQQAAQDEEELERMEANIRTFAAMEKTQRSQIIRRAIRKHVLVCSLLVRIVFPAEIWGHNIRTHTHKTSIPSTYTVSILLFTETLRRRYPLLRN